MIERTFEELVDILSIAPLSNDILGKIIDLIEQQTIETYTSFITESIQSLLALEHWAWQRMSIDFHQWIDQSNYLTLFHTLARFHKNLIYGL